MITKINYKNIKALAIDLDGTITNESGLIPDETLAYIRELQILGVRFIICTARDINSTLSFLAGYLSDREISMIGFVTSAGSHVYNMLQSSEGLAFDEISSENFDINLVRDNPALSSVFDKYKDVISIKKTAILVPFKDKIEALEYVKYVDSTSVNTNVSAYLYHNIAVLSSVMINKNNGLKLFMNRHGLKENQIIRLADQGDKYEADFHLLNFENGYTVGSKNRAENNKCNFILDEHGDILTGVEATNYLFQSIINQLKVINKA
jgi:hypothetical protein